MLTYKSGCGNRREPRSRNNVLQLQQRIFVSPVTIDGNYNCSSASGLKPLQPLDRTKRNPPAIYGGAYDYQFTANLLDLLRFSPGRGQIKVFDSANAEPFRNGHQSALCGSGRRKV